MIAWPIPVKTSVVGSSSYWSHSYSTTLKASLESYIWGYSYSRMNYLSDIYMYKPATISGLKLTQSYEVPSICLQYSTTFS